MATIQRKGLNLPDLLVRETFVDLVPGIEHLVRAFRGHSMDGNPYPLMLWQIKRLKGFQSPLFIDRVDNTVHTEVSFMSLRGGISS
jgi:hypothetical protein